MSRPRRKLQMAGPDAEEIPGRPVSPREAIGPRGRRTVVAPSWPDDCPGCQTRMAFEFAGDPEKPRVKRTCEACGVFVTENDVLLGRFHRPSRTWRGQNPKLPKAA